MPTVVFDPTTQNAATIAAIYAGQSAGTTYQFRGTGVFRGLSFIPRNGDIFQSYPGERAVLSGAVVLPVGVWELSSGLYRAPYNRTIIKKDVIGGYDINEEDPRASWNISVYINDVPLRQVASTGAVTSGFFYYDDVADYIYISYDPSTPNSVIEVNDTRFCFQLNSAISNVTIENLNIEKHCPAVQEAAIYASGAVSNLMVRGNLIRLNYAAGIYVGSQSSNGTKVLANVFDYNGSNAYLGQGSNHLLAGNIFKRSNCARIPRSFEGSAGKLSRAINCKIIGNLYLGGSGTQFGKQCWWDIDCQFCETAYNWFFDGFDSDIFDEINFDGCHHHNSSFGGRTNTASLQNHPWQSVFQQVTSQKRDEAAVFWFLNTVVLRNAATVGSGLGATQTNRGFSTLYPGEEYKCAGARFFRNRVEAPNGTGSNGLASNYNDTAFNGVNDNQFLQQTYEKHTGNNWQAQGVNMPYATWTAPPYSQDAGSTNTNNTIPVTTWIARQQNPYLDRLRMLRKVLRLFACNETSGTTATDWSRYLQTGTYTAPTFGQSGIGDGETAVRLTRASNSRLAFYSSQFDTAFNRDNWSIGGWFKVASGAVWTSAQIHSLWRIGENTGAGKFLTYARTSSTVNNRITIFLDYGGVGFSQNLDSITTTDWFHLEVVFDKAAGVARIYFNGALVSTRTGLGAASGAGALDNKAVVGSTGTTADNFDGFIQDFFVVSGITHTDAQVAEIYAYQTAPAINIVSDISADVGSPITPVTVTSPDSGVVWSLEGAPSWLSINSGTGQITGTPPVGTLSGLTMFRVRATKSALSTDIPVLLQTNPGLAPDERQMHYIGTETRKFGGEFYNEDWSLDPSVTPYRVFKDYEATSLVAYASNEWEEVT